MWIWPLLAALEDVATAGASTRHNFALRERLGIRMFVKKTGVWSVDGWGGRRLPELGLTIVPSDVTIAVRHLGEGSFATAWQDVAVPSRVWVRVPWASEDFSKELVARLLQKMDNPHLPFIRQVGRDEAATFYVMPFYHMPLRKENLSVEGWAQAKALRACHRAVYSNVWKWGMDVSVKAREDILACAKRDPVLSASPLLLEALEGLHEFAHDYGRGAAFDSFTPRNLGADSEGRLVLVDAIFNQDVLARRK